MLVVRRLDIRKHCADAHAAVGQGLDSVQLELVDID